MTDKETWRIELLGSLRAVRGDQIITRFSTVKTAALLAYLACRREQPTPRDELVDRLWPECERDAGRHRLAQALFSLRRLLEPPGSPSGVVIVARRTSLQLSPAVVTDVGEFEAATQAAARAASSAERAGWLQKAVDLYEGELLPGYHEEWVVQERRWLEEAYFRALGRWLQHLEDAGDWERGLWYARRGLAADPLREDVHCRLMRLYAAAGQATAALRQYRELERILREELALTPDPATCALAREIEQRAKDDLTAPVPSRATRSKAVPPAHVPCLGPGESVNDAVPLESAFYVVRRTDADFRNALAQRDSIILIKGARQMGKTSLLARGLHQARETGARVVLTDIQKLNDAYLESPEALLRTLAHWLAVQLELARMPDELWNAGCAPNINFELYLRGEALRNITAPIVWGLDEVDRLFAYPSGGELFRLFRSWHNERALDPGGPWSRLTLAIAYASEAHLFIADPNQSPFNVGTRLTLADFTPDQVADLNRRYHSPLRDEGELDRFFRLTNGHPYLVRRGLHALATRSLDHVTLQAEADQETGIYGDHLRRLLVMLRQDLPLCEAMRGVLRDGACPTETSFYRLRSAGLIAGESARAVQPRCRLYATYLARHLL